jgi:hypothetical protein
MQLPEAKAQLLDVADATISTAGGQPWSDELSEPDYCATSAGAGQQYTLQRIGPGVDDPVAIVHAVGRMWRNRGMEVEESWIDHGTVRLAVHVGGNDDAYIRFGANKYAMVLTALSVCVPDHVG